MLTSGGRAATTRSPIKIGSTRQFRFGRSARSGRRRRAAHRPAPGTPSLIRFVFDLLAGSLDLIANLFCSVFCLVSGFVGGVLGLVGRLVDFVLDIVSVSHAKSPCVLVLLRSPARRGPTLDARPTARTTPRRRSGSFCRNTPTLSRADGPSCAPMNGMAVY